MDDARLHEAADRLLARYDGGDGRLRTAGRAALRVWVEAAMRRALRAQPADSAKGGRRPIMETAPGEPPPV